MIGEGQSPIGQVEHDAGMNVQFTFKAKQAGKRRLWEIRTATVTMGESQVLELDKSGSQGTRPDEVKVLTSTSLNKEVDLENPTDQRARAFVIYILGGLRIVG